MSNSVSNAKIETLIADDLNANKGTKQGQRLIEKSLRELGAGRSILIDKNNRIIAGNKTFENAGLIGLNDVIIVETTGDQLVAVKRMDIDLDSKQGRELAIADNATSKSNIEWDETNINKIVEDWNINQNDWGIDDFEEKIISDENEDNIPEFYHENIVKSGDIIEMNNHRLMCGDTCNISDITLLLNGKKADLIFTDPPYDLEDNYSVNVVSSAKKDTHVFIMNSDKLLIQNIKNNEDYFIKMFFVDFRQARLVSNNQPMTRVDPIAEFCNGKTKFRNIHDGFSTLIECSKIHNNDAKQNHGFNQAKKVELPEIFILHYSEPNELVCDFFGGSGSTLIACEKNNRVCYMNEFEPAHCDIILKRWILYMKEHLKLFEVKINGEILSEEIINKISN